MKVKLEILMTYKNEQGQQIGVEGVFQKEGSSLRRQEYRRRYIDMSLLCSEKEMMTIHTPMTAINEMFFSSKQKKKNIYPKIKNDS